MANGIIEGFAQINERQGGLDPLRHGLRIDAEIFETKSHLGTDGRGQQLGLRVLQDQTNTENQPMQTSRDLQCPPRQQSLSNSPFKARASVVLPEPVGPVRQ